MNDDVKRILESQIRAEVDIQYIKKDLNEHIRRTDLLEELHKDNANRIERLEAPLKAKNYFKSLLEDVAKFSAFIVTLLTILKLTNIL